MRTASLLAILVIAGCSGPQTADEKALEDIRDTTIIPNLGSYDDKVQSESVQRMLTILDRAPQVGANLLVASLRDPVHDDRTKMVCAWLLSTVKDRRALPSLMTYLGHGSDTSESLVREALVSYGPSVVPAVARVLEEGNDLARISAAEVLIELQSSEGLSALGSRLVREPEARVRFLILCGLAADHRPESLASLERALDDEDPMNRELAWDAIGRRIATPDSLAFDASASELVRAEQLAIYHQWRASRRP